MADEQTPKTPKKRDRSEYMRQYYLKNREKLLKQHTKWEKDNPERNAESSRKYREKQKEIKKPVGGDAFAALDAIKKEITVYDVIFKDRTESYSTLEEAQAAYKKDGAIDIKYRTTTE